MLDVSAECEAAEYRLSDETMRRIDAGSCNLWQAPTFRGRVE